MTTDDLSHIEPGLRHLAVPISELKPYPRQTNTHDERNLAAIARSLRVHGQKKSLVANRQGEVIAGWGTVLAAQQLGWTHIAAVRSDEDEQGLSEYHLEDNHAAELAKRDEQKLLEELKRLETLGTGPDELGWTDEDVEALQEWTNILTGGTIDGTSTEREGQGVASTMSSMGNATHGFVLVGDLQIRVSDERLTRWRRWFAREFDKGISYPDSLARMIDEACGNE